MISWRCRRAIRDGRHLRVNMGQTTPSCHAAEAQPGLAGLLDCPAEEQRARGYFHTLREILQQPASWLNTCALVAEHRAEIESLLAGIQGVVLTGSGSSQHAGECIRLALQKELKTTVQEIAAGTLLTEGGAALPTGRPGLVVSLARSGDSPESAAVLTTLLETEPEIRHLVLTCNPNGTLAAESHGDSRIKAILLDERTNDQSLVMTSSFTNLALAARGLGLLDAPADYRALCERQSRICENLFRTHFDTLTCRAIRGFNRAVFLGSGTRWGAACEAALKMLEMTAGRVATVSETYLGLRHGPMSYIHEGTLVVCFLSSDPVVRAYETDLIGELNRKRLGLAKVIVGEAIPDGLLRGDDLAVELAGLIDLGDDNSALLHVVAGQLLAFGRSIEEGIRPDSPSTEGIISRVVERFAIHPAPGVVRGKGI